MVDLPPFSVTRPEGAVLVTLQVIEEDGRLICGIKQVTGHIPARPKAWLRAVREEVDRIAGLARAAGCRELRIAGRDWSRVFPGFEPVDGVPNGLKKELL